VIEWAGYLIQTSRAGKFRNPAGFYVYLLRNAVLPPREFETGRRRAAHLAEPATRSTICCESWDLENEYAEYRLRSVEGARHRAYSGELLCQKISELKGEICSQTPEADGWLPVGVEELALQKPETLWRHASFRRMRPAQSHQ